MVDTRVSFPCQFRTFAGRPAFRWGRGDVLVSEISASFPGDVDSRTVVTWDGPPAAGALVFPSFAEVLNPRMAPWAGVGRVRRVHLDDTASVTGCDVFEFGQLAAMPELVSSGCVERVVFLDRDQLVGMRMIDDVVRVPPVKELLDPVHFVPQCEGLIVETPPFGVDGDLDRIIGVRGTLPWHETLQSLHASAVFDVQAFQFLPLSYGVWIGNGVLDCF